MILGAGLSRRMGNENKLFLPINGKPMIEWVIENISASSVEEIILVGSELSMALLEKYQSARVKLVDNPNYETGMTSSIQAGVNEASGDGYMICLGDQPKIESSTYDQLVQAFLNQPEAIVLPFHHSQKGNPVILPSAFREEILTHKAP